MPKRKMLQLGLLGLPVSQSLSPAVSKALCAITGETCRYFRIETDAEELPGLMVALLDWGWDGFNVTAPHKNSAALLLDRLEGDAAVLKAVNTVKREKGKWLGYNTDVAGVTALMNEYQVDVAGKNVCVWGAGGAAKAAIYAVKKMGAGRVDLHNRTRENEEKLARMFKKLFPDLPVVIKDFETPAADDVSLFINTVPIDFEGTALVQRGLWKFGNSASGTAMDFLYGEGPTPFLEIAGMCGLKTILGTEVLIYQALAAWEIWTGVKLEPLKTKRRIEKKLFKNRNLSHR